MAAERDRQEATAALARAEGALSAGDLAAAELALTPAEKRLGTEGPADLATRLTMAKRDRDLLRGLREIQDMAWSPGDVTSADAADLSRSDTGRCSPGTGWMCGGGPEAAADAVRASRVSAPLALGLSEWFCIDPDGPNLRELLDRLDPDPDRATIRAAIQAARRGAGPRPGRGVGRGQGPGLVRGVGRVTPDGAAGSRGPAHGRRLADRPVGLRPGRPVQPPPLGDAASEEMLGWARVAVALRPDSPYAYGRLAVAWRAMRQWDEAEAVRTGHRASTEPSPGRRLASRPGERPADKGDFDGAEANYRAASSPPTRRMSTGTITTWPWPITGEATCWRPSRGIGRRPRRSRRRPRTESISGVGGTKSSRSGTRLEEVVDGRADPADPDEALKAIRVALHPSRGRRARAVTLFTSTVAANPALVDGLTNRHRYNTAPLSVLAAAGEVGAAQGRGGGAEPPDRVGMTWLRTDLARMTTEAKGPERHRQVGEWLTRWKEDPDLAPVRDPASPESMPPADAEAWRALWRDVDGAARLGRRQQDRVREPGRRPVPRSPRHGTAGDAVRLHPRRTADADNQVWQFVRVGDAYLIVSKRDGRVFDVEKGVADDGTRIIVYGRKEVSADNQLWVLTEVRK